MVGRGSVSRGLDDPIAIDLWISLLLYPIAANRFIDVQVSPGCSQIRPYALAFLYTINEVASWAKQCENKYRVSTHLEIGKTSGFFPNFWNTYGKKPLLYNIAVLNIKHFKH